MARTIHSIDDLNPNVFEAVKRAFIKRGVVPRSKRPPLTVDDGSFRSKSRAYAYNDSDDTYPERIAEGESDAAIEAEGDGQKKTLKKKPQDSKSAKGPETLTELTEKSQDVLYEATSVFPFTLIPDTITLDREKLTLAQRFFWRTAKISGVPVGEIMSAEANVGPFFGSLHLTFRFFANNERVINFLPRGDAIQMQRLIHGYIVAHRREIDVSNVPKEKLITLLCELGQGVTD